VREFLAGTSAWNRRGTGSLRPPGMIAQSGGARSPPSRFLRALEAGRARSSVAAPASLA